jgi:hypothetical protein
MIAFNNIGLFSVPIISGGGIIPPSFNSVISTFNIYGGPNYTIGVTSAVAAGQRIVLLMGDYSNSNALVSVTDTQGNSYTIREAQIPTNLAFFGGIADAYITNPLSTSDTITFTLSTAEGNYIVGQAIVLDNTDITQPDTTALGRGYGTPVSISGTTIDNTVCVGLVIEYAGYITSSPNGWTILANIFPNYGSIQFSTYYKEVSTGGTQDPQFATTSTVFGGAWISYK